MELLHLFLISNCIISRDRKLSRGIDIRLVLYECAVMEIVNILPITWIMGESGRKELGS